MRTQPNDDLGQLPGATGPRQDDIATTLAGRYEQRGASQPYTSIGDRLLVALNPNESTELASDQTATQYIDDYRDTSVAREALPPHVFKVAEQAYLHMRRTGLSQSITFM
ncbi:hypothetical protein H4S01_004880 [Coemansia sp. RSA 2610]|nr:hypothetical protein H4S01_004880 [Coemansia sp. RSA 2610]